MTAFQVVKVQPRKGFTAAQSREHQRDWTEKAWAVALKKGNFDRARQHLNFEIAGGKIQPIDKSKSIAQKMAENLAARGVKDPNEGRLKPNRRTVADLLFSGSHERMVEMAFGGQPVKIAGGNNTENLDIKRCPEIEQWAMDIYNFVADKYGEQNIISFYVHLDETTPHIHVAIVPVVDNKIDYKTVVGGQGKTDGPDLLSELHDEVAVVNKKWGLERGTSLTDEKSRGMQTFEFRRKLERDSREKQAELDELDEHLNAAKDELQAVRQELKKCEIRLKGLKTMIDNLEKDKTKLEKDLKEIERKIRNNEGDREELEKQMAEVQKQMHDTEEKLADKREKLSTAEQQLAAAQAAEKALSKLNSEMRREVNSISKDAYTASGIHLRNTMLDQVIAEYRQLVAALPASQPSQFEGSTLELIAEHGVEVLHCARLLMAGFFNEATTFAQSNGGGGGGGSDLKWGRDDDEDDDHWRRRCMAKACHMMKPAVKRGRKR